MQQKAIVWFRQDLRMSDNPALFHAAENYDVIPIFILDDKDAGALKHGGASRVWLHHSLLALDAQFNHKLNLYSGNAEQIIAELVERLDVNAVFWNRCYEPWRTARDREIKAMLKNTGVSTESFNGSLLWEPWEVVKADNTPYKVFTPFFKAARTHEALIREPLSAPPQLQLLKDEKSVTLNSLELLPKINWDTSIKNSWSIGEQAATSRLAQFLDDGLVGYKEGRNIPAAQHVSRLSPHLHFGEISPNQIWHAAQQQRSSRVTIDLDHFLSELAWREFSHHLLFHFPNLQWANFQPKFDAFPWILDEAALHAWQRGQTGYPLVDAGMRELWQTGYMHNRVRMVVASFLVKNLLIHWHHGERWFWDCLVDADLANNSASWQWVAGSGADAAPYFRIFNPVTQGEKFDPEGEYTRTFVPALAKLPSKYVHHPWDAPELVLKNAGIILGETYPYPIVDLKVSREHALDAYAQLKNAS